MCNNHAHYKNYNLYHKNNTNCKSNAIISSHITKFNNEIFITDCTIKCLYNKIRAYKSKCNEWSKCWWNKKPYIVMIQRSSCFQLTRHYRYFDFRPATPTASSLHATDGETKRQSPHTKKCRKYTTCMLGVLDNYIPAGVGIGMGDGQDTTFRMKQ